MSDTPRTDEEVASDLYGKTRNPQYVTADFARTIERELALMTERYEINAELNCLYYNNERELAAKDRALKVAMEALGRLENGLPRGLHLTESAAMREFAHDAIAAIKKELEGETK